MSFAVLPSIRKNPRLEWRMASETARLAALVASFPWTSTPMPISVIQRTRAIGFVSFVKGGRGISISDDLRHAVQYESVARRYAIHFHDSVFKSATRCADPVAGDDGRGRSQT